MSTTPSRRPQDPLYNPNKTIRNVQEIPDITPLRLFKVLYPLYSISVSGTHYDTEPFELIEKYIESYLEACKIATAQELVDFFGLRRSMVEKILHVLVAIKHISFERDHYELTQLGYASLKRGKKRLEDDQWGQKLFFDAYFLKPLPRTHSSVSKMHILSKSEAEALTLTNASKDWYQYQYNAYGCLSHEAPWRDSALDDLLDQKNRDAFNLPDEVTNLRREELEVAYVPMHIVVASKQRAGYPSTRYYVPFTHAYERNDTFFEELINRRQAGSVNQVQLALHAEDTIEQLNDFWEKWQYNTSVTSGSLHQQPNGTWQVNVTPHDIYSPNCKLPLKRIGSYWVEKGYFIKIWSNDEALRCEVAFENVISAIRSHSGVLTRQVVQQKLARYTKSLQTETLRLADLRHYIETKPDYADIVQALDNIDETL